MTKEMSLKVGQVEVLIDMEGLVNSNRLGARVLMQTAKGSDSFTILRGTSKGWEELVSGSFMYVFGYMHSYILGQAFAGHKDSKAELVKKLDELEAIVKGLAKQGLVEGLRKCFS